MKVVIDHYVTVGCLRVCQLRTRIAHVESRRCPIISPTNVTVESQYVILDVKNVTWLPNSLHLSIVYLIKNTSIWIVFG